MKTFFTIVFFTIFSCYAVNAATFESKASGTYGVASTWTITIGTDADGIPDLDDGVTIKAGHTVVLGGFERCGSMDIQSGGTLNGNGRTLGVYGNFNMAGNVISSMNMEIRTGSCLFSTPSKTYTAPGKISVFGSQKMTITSGSTIIKNGPITFEGNGAEVVNNGSVRLNTSGSNIGRIEFNFTFLTKWTNGAGSTLRVQNNFVGGAANLIDFSAANNTIIYGGSVTDIVPATYFSLGLNSVGTKTLTGNLTCLGDLGLDLLTGNALVLNGNTLSIGRDIYLYGSIFSASAVGGGKVIFNGQSGGTQTVSGPRAIEFHSLEINAPGGTVTFSNTSQNLLYNTLTLTDGDFNPNGKLTMVSNPATTARLDKVTNGTISGNLIIEKYFPGQAAFWFDMSCPVVNTTVNDWDNELYISGIGPYDGIGGPAGVDGDVVSVGNASFNYVKSMNTYDEPTAAYVFVTGSTTTLTPGVGYDFWFEDLTDNVWDAKTINSVGIPYTGNLTLTLSNTSNAGGAGGVYDGYQLVGNPYASAIDLNYIYDINNGLQNNMNTSYAEVLDGSASGGFVDVLASGIIYPHQGFWVQTNSGVPADMTFTEDCKVNTTTTAHNRQAPNYDIKLVLTSPTTRYYHENTINFDPQASLEFDRQMDGPFRFSPIKDAPSFFMIDANGKFIKKNTINSEADEVVMPLGFYTPKTGIYYIESSVLNMDGYKYAWIENIKTGQQYDINSSIAIAGVENDEKSINKDYVLRLSKTKKSASIAQTVLENDLIIFNTEGSVNLKSTITNHQLSEVTIYDMTGKLLLSQTNVNVEIGTVTKIDVSSLANGIYVVNAIDLKGNSISKKMVK